MPKYNKQVAMELAAELLELATGMPEKIRATLDASAELIDMLCEHLGKAISVIKTGQC